MITHPHPDPVAFAAFGWEVRWYGLMYLAGLTIAYLMAGRLVKRPTFADLRPIALDNLIIACVLGVILGGRLGYILFYKPVYFFNNPMDMLRIWTGGMSFHGGLLGVIAALWVLTFIYQTAPPSPRRHFFLRLLDFAAVLTPPGLGLGRLGNFINAELPGRVAGMDLPWLFNFGYPDTQPRHPSQLYQMLYEGFFLLALMLWLARRPRAAGWLAGVFVLAYALGRFAIEFFRQPDEHLGLLLGGLSMGQWLSLPMMAVGLLLIYRRALAQWWQSRQLTVAAVGATAGGGVVPVPGAPVPPVVPVPPPDIIDGDDDDDDGDDTDAAADKVSLKDKVKSWFAPGEEADDETDDDSDSDTEDDDADDDIADDDGDEESDTDEKPSLIARLFGGGEKDADTDDTDAEDDDDTDADEDDDSESDSDEEEEEDDDTDEKPGGKKSSFFAALFGGADDEEDDEPPARAPKLSRREKRRLRKKKR